MKDGLGVFDKMKMAIGKVFKDGIGPVANMKVELFDEHGNLKDVREVHNTVTTLGKNCAADQMLASPAVAKPGWMELGTGTPAATILGAYIAGSRTALDSKTRGANAIITMICTFGAGVGTGAITEAGVFNVVTQNTTDLIVSASFSVVNKAAGDTLSVTWTLTFA
jgi:hypothetical protein